MTTLPDTIRFSERVEMIIRGIMISACGLAMTFAIPPLLPPEASGAATLAADMGAFGFLLGSLIASGAYFLMKEPSKTTWNPKLEVQKYLEKT